jgi:regulatory protein
VRQRLGQKQVPEEVINEVVERLHRSGLIDDKRFVQTWIDNRTEFRPRSRRALAYELRGKGIDPQAIQDALAPFDEDEAAYAAARKYAQRLKQMEWPDFRQKMLGFLARRGFNYETASTALTRVWAERNGENATKDKPLYEEVDL